MATKFEKKIGYNSACVRDISEIRPFSRGFWDQTIQGCEILKGPTQVAMATKFETITGYNSACIGDI